MKLVIGNKRYSSWSLRPWLLLKHFDIPFDEILIPLDQPETTQQILKFSPNAKVPALVDGQLTIWESLAIAEYLHDKFPAKNMWPKNFEQRAHARCVANEMHAGFATMRQNLSHDLNKELQGFDWSSAKADIARVKEIWTDCFKRSKGPFLYGDFSIADAMYAPVVNRFYTYDVPRERGAIANYCEAIRNLPAHKEWIDAAKAETLRVPRYE